MTCIEDPFEFVQDGNVNYELDHKGFGKVDRGRLTGSVVTRSLVWHPPSKLL